MQSMLREPDPIVLVRRLKDRDPEALAAVYDCYGRLAFHVILQMVGNRSTAEDLTQETFLRIWNGISRFDDTRGSLKTWVLVLARNRAIDYLRSVEGRMVREAVAIDTPGLITSSIQMGKQFLTQEATQLLRQAMASLTPNQRLVLDLCYCEGMTHEEIAHTLDRPLGTIKTWIRRAVQTLRETIE